MVILVQLKTGTEFAIRTPMFSSYLFSVPDDRCTYCKAFAAFWFCKYFFQFVLKSSFRY